MTKKSTNKCKYEEEQFYKPSDVINKDLDLLLLLIFLEAQKEGKTEIRMTDLMKGNYWDHSDIKDEVSDTNDYWSIEDMVLEQIVFLVEDQRLGNLVGVKIDNPSETLQDLVFKATKLGDSVNKDDVGSICCAIEQVTFLEHQDKEIKQKLVEENPDRVREIIQDRSIFIGKDRRYITAVQAIAIEAPEHIILEFIFDEKGIEKFKKEVDDYVDKFRNDEFQDDLPRYQEKRLYFVKQIENFYRYISKVNLIGDTLNIPFSILSERGFEAVKILKYLEKNGLVELRWSDEGSWKVKFNEIPITPNSLLGIKSDKGTVKSSKLKFNLSFTSQTGILVFKNSENEYKIKIQGQVQKEVLRAMFKNPKNTYTDWSLYDISNILGPQDVDRKSIQNAVYQLNRKVKMEIPEIEKLLDGDQHSIIFNEKYVEKN